MKRKLTILTLFIVSCVFAFAQTPDWGFFDEGLGNGYLGTSVTASIYIDGVEQTCDGLLEVAPFSGEERRGVPAQLVHSPFDTHVVMLLVKGGNYIQFKLYDYRSHSMYQNLSEQGFNYVENGIYGNSVEPYRLDFKSVAEVNGLKYGSLQDAYNAAQEGDVITITNNTTGPGLVIDKDITINFDGKTYTFNEGVGNIPSNGFQILQGNDVTLKGGTLNVAEANKNEFYILVQNYANLTVDDMVLDGTNLDKWSAVEDNWDSYTLSNNSGNVNIIGDTEIIANNEGANAFAFDACKYLSYEAPVVTLASTVTVDGIAELSGGELYSQLSDLQVVAKKEFKGAQTSWNTISTPIADAAIPAATAGVHDIYYYEEPTMMWRYYTGEGANNPYATLELGRGYLYANAEDILVELRGELNVSDINVELSYTDGSLAGFNMIGNPFSHSIGSANFVTEAVLAGGFYTIGEGGEWLAKTGDQMIAPMESVLVKADRKAPMKITNSSNAKARSDREELQSLAISVANSNYRDVAYVSFAEGLGLDKINHRNEEAPMVSVPVDGKEYAVAMMNKEVTEIPLTFKAATMGEYTIGIEANNCEYASMTLVDRLTGEETNMLLEEYTFVATTKDNVNRFLIQLSMKSDNNDTENFAYINNGMMNIDNVEGQGLVKIFDVTGRYVAEYNVFESATISTSEFAAGMYVVQMTDEKGVKVQKIIID